MNPWGLLLPNRCIGWCLLLYYYPPSRQETGWRKLKHTHTNTKWHFARIPQDIGIVSVFCQTHYHFHRGFFRRKKEGLQDMQNNWWFRPRLLDFLIVLSEGGEEQYRIDRIQLRLLLMDKSLSCVLPVNQLLLTSAATTRLTGFVSPPLSERELLPHIQVTNNVILL